MKRFLYISFLLLFATNTNAQYDVGDQHHDGFISINLGASIPMGKFGEVDSDYGSSSAALTGGIADIQAGMLMSHHMGLMVSVRGAAWPVDVKGLENQLKKQDSTIDWKVTSDPWISVGFLLGIYGDIKIAEGVFIDPRAMVGFMNVSAPELKIVADDGAMITEVKRLSKSTTTVAYLVGMVLHVDITENVFVQGGADYLIMKQKFNTGVSVDGGEPIPATMEPDLNNLNITIGLGFKL